MHYGYIGQGNLGANCAACLLRAGMDVTVTDINRDAAEAAIALRNGPVQYALCSTARSSSIMVRC